jgi:hypothetical protein
MERARNSADRIEPVRFGLADRGDGLIRILERRLAQKFAARESSLPNAVGSTAGLGGVLGRDARAVRVDVARGITDGTGTEVVDGDLNVRPAVLVGLQSGPPTTPSSTGPDLRL